MKRFALAGAVRLQLIGVMTLILSAVLATPARAADVVGTSARFTWTAATGPVADYAVFVSRNGGAFPATPDQIVTTTQATIPGAIGDAIQVRVNARDAAGTLGPPSPVSVTVNFVAAAPVLTLGSTSLAAITTQGQNAGAQSFTIRNTGGGTLAWSVSDDAAWLTLSPASGSTTTATDSVAVSYATSGLAAGSYSATITVSATGVASQTIPVSLTVNAPPPVLTLGTTAITQSVMQGQNAAAATFTIQNGGGGTLAWSVSDDAAWLAESPATGSTTTGTDTVTLSFATSGLAAGTYNATITVAATGLASQTIPVTLTVTTGPILTLSTSTLAVNATRGTNPAAQTFTIRNGGAGTLSYTVSDNATWMTVSPTSGTATTETDTVTLTLATSTLTAGTYTGTVTVGASGAQGAPATVTVTVTVVDALGAPGQPTLVVAP